MHIPNLREAVFVNFVHFLLEEMVLDLASNPYVSCVEGKFNNWKDAIEHEHEKCLYLEQSVEVK